MNFLARVTSHEKYVSKPWPPSAPPSTALYTQLPAPNCAGFLTQRSANLVDEPRTNRSQIRFFPKKLEFFFFIKSWGRFRWTWGLGTRIPTKFSRSYHELILSTPTKFYQRREQFYQRLELARSNIFWFLWTFETLKSSFCRRRG